MQTDGLLVRIIAAIEELDFAGTARRQSSRQNQGRTRTQQHPERQYQNVNEQNLERYGMPKQKKSRREADASPAPQKQAPRSSIAARAATISA
jgi:hypothetical protein